ncbi:hypothetical protein TNCV_4626691 [Trichonephila clavipes]|nr:hypothetical protein TNCV_4626691 [Trichonephila clavipes]
MNQGATNNVFQTTVQRSLLRLVLRSRRLVHAPMLTAVHQQRRLEFSYGYRNWASNERRQRSSNKSSRSHPGNSKRSRKTSSVESKGRNLNRANAGWEDPRLKRKVGSNGSVDRTDKKRSKICRKRSLQGSEYGDQKKPTPESSQGIPGKSSHLQKGASKERVLNMTEPRKPGQLRTEETMQLRGDQSGLDRRQQSGEPERKVQKGSEHRVHKRTSSSNDTNSVLPKNRKKSRTEKTVTPTTSGCNLRPRNGKGVESRPTLERKTQE